MENFSGMFPHYLQQHRVISHLDIAQHNGKPIFKNNETQVAMDFSLVSRTMWSLSNKNPAKLVMLVALNNQQGLLALRENYADA